MSRTVARVRKRLRGQGGFTLAELLVAMMILVIVIVIFDGALVSIQQGVASEDLRSQNNDQARLAIESLDREIRSANYIYDPTTETSRTFGGSLTNGFALRIYGQSNASTRSPAPGYLCELWQITPESPSSSQRLLQVKTWPPFQSGSASSWQTVATGVVNRAVSPTVAAFAVDPGNPSGTNRTIDITILSNVSLSRVPNATVRTQVAITGRDTSFGFPASECA
jgi:prepilin-type N-terminal cleavage/methylation domain-containing protein